MMNEEDKELQEQMKKNLESNARTASSDIRLLGDKMTIIQIIRLLAYIRHDIKNNNPHDITLHIGKNIANGQFMFDVNQFEIKDLISKDEIDIN